MLHFLGSKYIYWAEGSFPQADHILIVLFCTHVSLDNYYDSHKLSSESPLEFCVRYGWAEYIYQMLVVDYLILNRDRHGANMEVLTNRYRKTIRLAPLFDHGVSLFCRCRSIEELEKERSFL